METGLTVANEIDIQKFWSRRIAGPHHEEVTTADVLLENQVLFPPAQVQVPFRESSLQLLLNTDARNSLPGSTVSGGELVGPLRLSYWFATDEHAV